MLNKIIEIGPYFYDTDEPSIRILNDEALKTASSEAVEYFEKLEKIPGKTLILVLAMGASEYWGCNRRGDYWPEKPIPGLVGPDETLLAKYKTFETNAKIYLHHVNYDPAKSIGDVVKAFYNHNMHRVELILAVDNEKGKEQVEALKQNKFLPVSMGAKVKYDVCSICGHISKTVAEYCDHARNMMNKIFPDGRKVYVINCDPVFKDISIVRKPADPTAYTQMIKAASYSDYVIPSAVEGEERIRKSFKVAFLNKFSEIYKRVVGHVQDVKGIESNHEHGDECFIIDNIIPNLKSIAPLDLDDKEIETLAKYPIQETLRALGRRSIFLYPEEFLKLFGKKMGIEGLEEALSAITAVEPVVIESFAENPDIFDYFVRKLGLDDDYRDKYIVDYAITPDILDKKAYVKEYVARRMVPRALQKDWEPQLELVEFQDPDTGETIRVPRGALWQARQSIGKKQLQGLLGITAGSLAAYKILSAHPAGLAILGIPIALVGARNMKRIVNDPSNIYTIPDLEEKVPEFTEIEKKSSMSDALANPAIPVTLGIGSAMLLPVLKETVFKSLDEDNLLNVMAEHPILSGIIIAGTTRALQNALSKKASSVSDVNEFIDIIGETIYNFMSY